MAKRTTSRAAVVPRHPCFGPLRAGTGQCDVNRGRHGPVLDKGAIDPGPTRTARGGRSNARGNNRFCSEALILLRASREHDRADCPLARGRGSIARHAPRGGAGARAIVQHRPSDSFVGIDTAKWLQPLATRLFNRPSQTLIRLRSSSLRQSNLSSICCILPDHINYFTYSQEIVHPESSSLTSFHVVGHRRTLQAVGWFRSRRPVLPVHPCTFGTQGARSIWHRNR